VIEKKLLWKAWPCGYLARGGLETVGGWSCLCPENPVLWSLGVDEPAFHVWNGTIYHPFRCEKRWAKERIKFGDLLPNVDPKDVATWACCLADLAQALDWPHYQNVGWWKLRAGWWHLHGSCCDETRQEEGKFHSKSFRDLPETEDPALALVLARIQIREETGK